MRNLNNPYRGKVILLLLTVFISLTTQAQLNYSFTASTTTYTANSGGTTLISTGVDDAFTTAQDIGFTFTYGCINYSKFIASSNGFISLGAVLSDAIYINDIARTGQGPLLAPLWDDLRTRATNITWGTENEINIDHYTVERSADGRSFTAMADVKSNTAATLQQSYNWTDAAPLPGTSYYRLKFASGAAAATYSPVFTFTDCGTDVVKLANNITSGESELVLQLSQNARIEIGLFDVMGRRYAMERVTGKHSLAQGTYYFPVTSNLRTGIYLLSVNINGNKKMFRLVK